MSLSFAFCVVILLAIIGCLSLTSDVVEDIRRKYAVYKISKKYSLLDILYLLCEIYCLAMGVYGIKIVVCLILDSYAQTTL